MQSIFKQIDPEYYTYRRYIRLTAAEWLRVFAECTTLKTT